MFGLLREGNGQDLGNRRVGVAARTERAPAARDQQAEPIGDGVADVRLNVGIQRVGGRIGNDQQIGVADRVAFAGAVQDVAAHLRRWDVGREEFVRRVWQWKEEFGGRIWVIMYGIRIHGESLYGDISFVWPAFEDAWEFMKYMPMGFPMLSFGFQIGGDE